MLLLAELYVMILSIQNTLTDPNIQCMGYKNILKNHVLMLQSLKKFIKVISEAFSPTSAKVRQKWHLIASK